MIDPISGLLAGGSVRFCMGLQTCFPLGLTAANGTLVIAVFVRGMDTIALAVEGVLSVMFAGTCFDGHDYSFRDVTQWKYPCTHIAVDA